MGEHLGPKIKEFAPGTVSKEARKAIRNKLNSKEGSMLHSITEQENAGYIDPITGKESSVFAMSTDGGKTAIIWVKGLNG